MRAEVWQAREERKELASYLASLPYSDSERRKIEAYPSRFADDAEFISAFINEVGRNRDTARALKAGGPLPSGNWIHIFHDFGEVISALQAQVFSGIPVAEAVLRRLLRSEVVEILRRCILKVPGYVGSPRGAVEEFLRKYPLTIENKGEDSFEIDTTAWDGLTWYAYHLIALQFHPMILDSAIVSPFFLKFRPTVNAFEETRLHQALVSLRDEVRRFNESNNSESLAVIYEHSPRQRGYRNGTVAVEPMKLTGLLHLYDRWINIIELCTAIYRHLDGKPFVTPSLRSRSPVCGMDQKFDQEIPTVDEAIQFINFDHDSKRGE